MRTKEEMRQEMLLQLHEQYAQNNNANFNSVVGLITASIVILGFYGYVLAYSSNEIAFDFKTLSLVCVCKNSICSCPGYPIEALILITVASLVVLSILQYICLYQGSHQRCEQFIIHTIRCENGLVNGNIENNHILHLDYSPFKKTDIDKETTCVNFCNIIFAIFKPNKNMQYIVQGLFGVLVFVFSILEDAISVLTMAKLFFTTNNLCYFFLIGALFLFINGIVGLNAMILKDRYLELHNKYKKYDYKTIQE